MSGARVALVTGSAKRLGRALVEALAAEGWVVWIHYRSSAAEAEALATRLRASGAEAHLTSGDVAAPEVPAQIAAQIAATSGRLDLLVNNVGVYHTADLLDYSYADFDYTLRANLLGCFALIQACLPLFPAEGGAVINLGYTGLGALAADPENTAYVISKTGLLLLTRAYADRLGPRKIRVNMISPGQLENSVDLPEDFDEHVPLGRAGRLEDVVAAALYLASPEAGYVTGQNLEIAGGYMMRLQDRRA